MKKVSLRWLRQKWFYEQGDEEVYRNLRTAFKGRPSITLSDVLNHPTLPRQTKFIVLLENRETSDRFIQNKEVGDYLDNFWFSFYEVSRKKALSRFKRVLKKFGVAYDGKK